MPRTPHSILKWRALKTVKYWIWKGSRVWARTVQNNLILWELFNYFFLYKHSILEVTQIMLYHFHQTHNWLENAIIQYQTLSPSKSPNWGETNKKGSTQFFSTPGISSLFPSISSSIVLGVAKSRTWLSDWADWRHCGFSSRSLQWSDNRNKVSHMNFFFFLDFQCM